MNDFYEAVLERYRAYGHDQAAEIIANATSRAGGAVGSNAIVPKWVREHVPTTASILDFGAGKQAAHAQDLQKQGFRVTAYDYGQNFDESVHDPDALDGQYDVVYASNVLNVQDSVKELRTTIKEASESVRPGGYFVANLPASPRKGAFSGSSKDGTDMVKAELEKVFGRCKIVQGGSSSPVFLCKMTQPERYAMGSSQQLTQAVPIKRPPELDSTVNRGRNWTPEEARKHPRGNPANTGQFAPKASSDSMPAQDTALGPVKPSNPKWGWKLAQGYTSDSAVVEKMKRRAAKLGYIAKINPSKFADGTVRYTITIFSRKGEKMKQPDQFYDMDAAGASIAVMPDEYAIPKQPASMPGQKPLFSSSESPGLLPFPGEFGKQRQERSALKAKIESGEDVEPTGQYRDLDYLAESRRRQRAFSSDKYAQLSMWGPEDEQKHPRGNPINSGQFSSKPTAGPATAGPPTAEPVVVSPTAPGQPHQKHELRIQRKRQKGYKVPAGAVVVTRPTVFGNPFPVKPGETSHRSVNEFRNWLLGKRKSDTPEMEKQRRSILHRLPELKGKQLACYCSPNQPCHADVLAELANSPDVKSPQKSLFTLAQSFADACVEHYVKSGYRSAGTYDSPGQKTFGFSSPRTKPFREWGFEEEQKHPRGGGGKFRNKWGVKPTKKKDLPLFDQPKQKEPEPFNDSHLKKISDWMEKLGHKAAGTGAIKAAGLTPEQAKSTTLSPDQQMTVLFNLGVLGKEGFEKHLWGHTSDTDPKPMDLPRFLIRLSSAMHKHSDQAKRQAAAQRIPEGTEMVLFRNSRGQRLLLHPATRADRTSEWQLTQLTADNQPWGHTNPPSFEEGIRRALGVSDSHLENEHGYDIEWTNKDGKPAPYSQQAVQRYSLVCDLADAFADYYGPERYAQMGMPERYAKQGSLFETKPRTLAAISPPKKLKSLAGQKTFLGAGGSNIPPADQMKPLGKAAAHSHMSLWDFLNTKGYDVHPEDRKPGGIMDDFVQAANDERKSLQSQSQKTEPPTSGLQVWRYDPGPRQPNRWRNNNSGRLIYQTENPNKVGVKQDASQVIETPGVSSGPESEPAPRRREEPKQRPTPPKPDELFAKAKMAGQELTPLDVAATNYQFTWKDDDFLEINDDIAKLIHSRLKALFAPMGGVKHPEYKDTAQDVFHGIFRSLHDGKYDPSKSHFSSFISGVTENTFKRRMQNEYGRGVGHRKGDKTAVQTTAASQVKNAPSDIDIDTDVLDHLATINSRKRGWSPEEQMSFQQQLENAAAQLKPRQKKVLNLYVEDAMTTGERPHAAKINRLLQENYGVHVTDATIATDVRLAKAQLQNFTRSFWERLHPTQERPTTPPKRKPTAFEEPRPTIPSTGPAPPKKPPLEGFLHRSSKTPIKEYVPIQHCLRRAANAFADAVLERYAFIPFNPSQHQRAMAGDPTGAGGQFVSMHGPSPADTHGINIPKLMGAATKALGAAAPPVPKPMRALLAALGKGNAPKQRQPRQAAKAPTARQQPKKPAGNLIEQAKANKAKREQAQFRAERADRLKRREKRLGLKEDRLSKEEEIRQAGGKPTSLPKGSKPSSSAPTSSPETEPATPLFEQKPRPNSGAPSATKHYPQPSEPDKRLPIEEQKKPTGAGKQEAKHFPQPKPSSPQKELQETPEEQRQQSESAPQHYPMTAELQLQTMTPKQRQQAAAQAIKDMPKVSDSGSVRNFLNEREITNPVARKLVRGELHAEYNQRHRDWKDLTSELNAILGEPDKLDQKVANKQRELQSLYIKQGKPESVAAERAKEESVKFRRNEVNQHRRDLMRAFQNARDPDHIYVEHTTTEYQTDPKTKKIVPKNVTTQNRISMGDYVSLLESLSEHEFGMAGGGSANFPQIWARIADKGPGAKAYKRRREQSALTRKDVEDGLFNTLREQYTDPVSGRSRQTMPYQPSLQDPDIFETAIANSGIGEFKNNDDLINYLAKRHLESKLSDRPRRNNVGDSWESEDFTLYSVAKREFYTHFAAAYYNGGKVENCIAN